MATHHTVDIDSGSFHVLSWGAKTAPPLLLLHGFNQTAHSWIEFAAHAEKSYRVIAVTQRGHGDSARAADGDYSRDAMVSDAARVADALGLETFRLIGMSMGAVHAVGLANTMPDRVIRLVLVDWAPQVDPIGVDKIKLMFSRRWRSFDDAVAEVMHFNPRRSEANIRSRLQHTIGEGDDGWWTWKVDPAFAQSDRFQLEAETMWQAVRKIRCPTLVVRGENSDILPADTAERMRDALADGQLATVTGAGHSVPGDNPTGFADAVLPFVAG